MKFKEKRKTLYFAAFLNYRVIIVLTSDIHRSRDRILDKYKFTGNRDNDLGGVSIHVKSIAATFLVLPFKTNINSIVHESWHCINQLMRYHGAELEDEVVAYYLGYLAEQVYNFIKKK